MDVIDLGFGRGDGNKEIDEEEGGLEEVEEEEEEIEME